MSIKHKHFNPEEPASYSGSWKKILLEVYNYAPQSYFYGDISSFKDNIYPLAKTLKMNNKDLAYGVVFLQKNRLIKIVHVNNKVGYIELTEKGFKVALEIEKQKTNNTVQAGMLIFTAILTLASITQIYYGYSKDPTGFNLIVLSIFCLFIIFIGGFYFYLRK